MTADREGTVFEAVAPPEADGERLDRMLARAIPALSRSRIQALIAEGRVVPEARKAVAGQTYRVSVPPVRAAGPEPEAIPLTVVHEDAHLIVVDKPAGMVVHPAPGHAGGTLVNALLHHCGPGLTGVGGVARPGIVHRLDKDTSGLIVAAKTETAHAGLRALFETHDIDRGYLALVQGLPSPAAGRIEAPIGRDPRHRKRMAVVERGRPAVTHYRVEAAFGTRASSRRLQAGDRADASGAGPSGPYRPRGDRGSALWRAAARNARLSVPGAPRRTARFPPSCNRRGHAVREPAAGGLP